MKIINLYEYYADSITVNGKHFEIFHNPSLRDVLIYLREFNEMRGIITKSGDFYLWEYRLLHNTFLNKAKAHPIFSLLDYMYRISLNDTALVFHHMENLDNSDIDELLAFIHNSSFIKSLRRRGFEIHGAFFGSSRMIDATIDLNDPEDIESWKTHLSGN